MTLGPHDVYVVSRETEHKPVTTGENHILSLAFGRDPSGLLKRRQESSWERRIQAINGGIEIDALNTLFC